MKSVLGAIAVAGMTLASASAADLAVRPYTKAPAYVAPVYNWTGFYAGANIGGAFGGDDGATKLLPTTTVPLILDAIIINPGGPALNAGRRGSAFLGGGQIGFNYQFAPNWVLGVEGDISGLSKNDRYISYGTAVFRDRIDWLASVTGRLGYTWGPGMIYAKGGAAFRNGDGLTGNVTFTDDRDSTGYTVGGGLEYMFAPAWSAKIEYQYYNFGTTTVGGSSPVFNYKDDLHTVKAGINYHFN